MFRLARGTARKLILALLTCLSSALLYRQIQPLPPADQATGGARVPAPGHDGRVRQVELEPAAAGEPVRRRRRRRWPGGGEGAPVARRRGPHRAGQPVQVHQPEAAVGRLPRAPQVGTSLPDRRGDG
ncbi:alpha/beta-Hydrolases superfamily protein [Zea mays]|uniref:Alpha/beta-Hydrolases superfamily protein n=1 Tax=Zea mays TaxID=4577 RepID=A0A1D6EBL9_MAIZE|nr:alpha/beta-Hydrolases superfamily protein [Zea mays]